MTEAARALYLLVAVLGLVPVVRLAGMPVLAASAFAAVGGVGALQLERAGLPIGGAVLVAIVLGGAAGALTGGVLARAEAPFAALATWALAWLAYTVLLDFPSLSGGGQGLTRPALDTVQTPIGVELTLTPRLHVAAATVLCGAVYALTVRLPRTPLGRGALAVRADPAFARVLGLGGGRVELLALAGAAAAAGGAGIAVLLGVAAPADVSPLLALELLAAALAATRHPLLGAAVIVALPHLPDWLTAIVLLAAVALRREATPRADTEAPAPPGDLPRTADGLRVRDLRVRRGGRPILRGLELELRPGEIHALIGPNGSGKTTALETLGIPHTLQRDAGFGALTPHAQLALVDAGRAWTYLALVGLTDRAHAPTLAPGERRLLAVALVAATGAPALAFDEPAAGLSAAQRATLTAALRRLAGAGRALLVVEHDLRLVAALADTVTVLDEGAAIARGAPREVIADATVRRVYLGTAA